MFLIVHQLKKEFAEIVGEYDLTEMEAKFLLHIGHGNSKISDLIRYFEKHKSTIRQKTKSLEEKGYIISDSDSEDKRERNLYFTQKGTDFFAEMKHLRAIHFKKVFKDFSKKELQMLEELLIKINVTSNDTCNL